MQSSDTPMMPVSAQSQPHQPTAVWPWFVMPAVVLIVFCILHYDVRPLGNPKVMAPAQHSRSSETGSPAG
jgi:hypothetical protein